jgi:hypothetical protein
MTPPPLEDRLNRLADQLAAPATSDARRAIGRRAGTLRRRRQVGRAVGSGVLLLLVVAGAVALRLDDPADVEIEPAGPAAGSLPALTADGWTIVTAEDAATTPAAGEPYDPASGSLQVFRRPGDLAGPSLFLHHEVASDAIAADAGTQPVGIAGSEGYLQQTGPESFIVRWAPPRSDSHAYLEARGFARDEVIQFANGLQLKDDNIQYPPAPDVQLGFVATMLPKGIQEDPVSRADPGRTAVRRLVVERASAAAEVAIDDRGEAAFEAYLGQLLASGGDVERVSVMDHPAVLVDGPNSGRWSIVWRQTDEATVVASLSGMSRSSVDDFVGDLRAISDDDWRALVAGHEEGDRRQVVTGS